MKARPRQWTPEEDQYLRNNAATQTLRAMGDALHREDSAVWGRLKRLGIMDRKNKPHRAWTKREQFQLMTYSEKYGIQKLMELMGRSKDSIFSQVKQMGLRLRCDVYSLNSACKATGYHYTQLERARDALGQLWRWERFRGFGRFTISQNQLEALCEYLKTEGQQEAA